MLRNFFLTESKYLWSAILGGFLYASGFPLLGNSFYFSFGPTLGLILLFYPLLKNNAGKPRQWFFSLVLFSFGLFLLGFYWIPQTLLEFGEIPTPLNYFLGALFSIFLLPHFYFLLALVFTLNKKYILHKKPFFWSILIALFATIFEMYVPQQFPAHVGHGWMAFAPHLGLAPFFGAGIFSCINYFLAFALLFVPKHWKNYAILSIIFILFISVNFFLAKPFPRGENSLAVRIVQANIGNNLKISAEKGAKDSLDSVLSLYQELSLEKKSITPDLIIWPETAYPILLSGQNIMKGETALPRIFQDILMESKASLFFGGYDQNPLVSPYDYFESEFNTAFLLSPELKISDLYHKHLLIPFGEGLPFGPLNQPLSTILKNVSFFAEGKEFPLFRTHKGQHFMTAICYEILFPNFLRQYVMHVSSYPHFIVNLTNDSWYGDTSEPHQHLFLAKWRALEFNIPLIRSTNTGITTIIYPDGVQDGNLHFAEVASLDKNVSYIDQPPTFYARHGNQPLFFGLGLILLVVFVRRLFKNK